MDSLFDNLIFLIPIAIVIVRVVAAAKSKGKDKAAPKWPATRPAQQQPERPSEPAISIHFEDDDEETKRNIQRRAAQVKSAARRIRAPVSAVFAGDELESLESAAFQAAVSNGVSSAESRANKNQAVKSGAAAEQAGFPLNLNKLSPLKQAVVMAEILGPPKGLL